MLIFSSQYYRLLADEIARQIEGRALPVFDAVELESELECGNDEIIFGYHWDGQFAAYLMITTQHGVRCGNDFEIERLAKLL